MKKRVVSLFLCIVMLVSLLSVNAFAAGKFTVKGSTNELELKTGAKVDFTVEITENPGVICGKIDVSYDSSAFSLEKVTENSTAIKDEGNLSQSLTGKYAYSFGSDTKTENITYTGKILTLTFKVLDAAQAKEYPITISAKKSDTLNADVDEIETATTDGSITLKAPVVEVKSVTLNQKTANMYVGNTLTLTATVNPANATDKTLKWTSSNETVATVEDGTVTAKAAGKATITVTTANGKTAKCDITVAIPPCDHEKTTHHEQVDASCDKAGTKEYWECSECGLKFADAACKTQITNVTIPAKGHTEGTAATCKAKATCSTCGNEYGVLGQHDLTSVSKVPATCGTDGTKAYYECGTCHDKFSDAKGKKSVNDADLVIPATGNHTFASATTVKEGVCDKKIGVDKYECSVCGNTYYRASAVFTMSVKVTKAADSKKDVPDGVKFTVDNTDGFNTTPATFVTNGGDETLKQTWKQWYDVAVTDNMTEEQAIAEAVAGLKDSVLKMKQTTDSARGWKTIDKTVYTVKFASNGNDILDFTLNVTKTAGKEEVAAEDGVLFENIYEYKKTGSSTYNSDVYKDLMDGDSGKTVKSSKTFDAGVGLYVGMSILSLTGSALVIGKKKHF